MNDNNFWVIFWFCFFSVICFIAYLVYEYNKEYNKKIVAIQRYEYVIKLPNDGLIIKTQDIQNEKIGEKLEEMK